jgi:hypothetical protein
VGRRRLGSAAIITLALSAASCSITSDGLAVSGEEIETTTPGGRAAAPAGFDGGAAVTGAAPPVVIPPDAGASPAAPPAVTPPAGGPVTTPPVTTPPTPRILRAHDIKAKRITAGIAYVHKLEAKTGTAGKIVTLPSPPVDLNLGTENLEVDELVVDTLYAHEVKADHIEIRETQATEVKIGKRRLTGEGQAD